MAKVLAEMEILVLILVYVAELIFRVIFGQPLAEASSVSLDHGIIAGLIVLGIRLLYGLGIAIKEHCFSPPDEPPFRP